MLAKTLLSFIFFTSSLIFLYRAALLEVLSNKLQNAKQKAERNCETKKKEKWNECLL